MSIGDVPGTRRFWKGTNPACTIAKREKLVTMKSTAFKADFIFPGEDNKSEDVLMEAF